MTPTNTSKKATVLVVDDSRVMRKAIERVLKSEFDLIEADDGEAGWNVLKGKSNIDVVISDVQMPVLDGYGFICRIRAADKVQVSDVPVIVITSADDEITKERAYACGANDFIIKPIDSAQLLTAIRNYTGAQEVSQTVGVGVDPLTQVANREGFLTTGRKVFDTSHKSGETISLVRFDIDDFDELRSQFGDNISDHILIWISNILLKKIRKQDTIGQLGRGQFAVLTSSSGRVETAVMCDRIRAGVSAKPFEEQGQSISVSLSIGLATVGHDAVNSIEELIDIASQRVAISRSRGGNLMIAGDNETTGTIEETVMEVPDIETALQILAGNTDGNFEPYAIDLALQVLPLIEYCNEQFGLESDRDIAALKAKLIGAR